MTSREFHGRPSVDYGATAPAESTIDSPRPRRYHYRAGQSSVEEEENGGSWPYLRCSDAGERRKEQAVGRWHDPRNKSLTRRFRRENAYGADNFEFRSHDPTMSGGRRGISQTRTLSYESLKWSRRRMNLGKLRDETLKITKRVRAAGKRELGPPSRKAFLFTDKSVRSPNRTRESDLERNLKSKCAGKFSANFDGRFMEISLSIFLRI